MKKGPIAHGALLVIALVIAYQGWTKEEDNKPTHGTVEVWKHDASSFVGIAYDSERKSLNTSWRTEGSERYLWADHTRTKFKPTPKKDKDKDKDGEDKGEIETVSRSFPVDEEAGEELIEQFSTLMALSKLGPLDDAKKEEFGLSESKDTLSVSFKGSQENLIIGARVYGGSDRYALHAESGQAYVLSAKILRSIESGETSLKLKKLQGFEKEQLSKVHVESEGATKDMVKIEVTDDKGKRDAWASADAPQKADLTLDSFLDRADKLAPVEFVEPDPAAKLVVKLGYHDKGGKEIGYLEFYRKVPPELEKGAQDKDKDKDKDEDEAPAVPDDKKADDNKADDNKADDDKADDDKADDDKADDDKADDDKADDNKADDDKKPPEIEYFVRTSKTRVWGKLSRLGAERFDQDVASLFEREPPPTTPAPARKKRPRGAPGPHGRPGPHGAMPGRPGPHGGPPPGMKPPGANPAGTTNGPPPAKPAPGKAPAKPKAPAAKPKAPAAKPKAPAAKPKAPAAKPKAPAAKPKPAAPAPQPK